MRRRQKATGIESRGAEPVLTHEPVHWDQALADRINREKKTLERDGAEQGWTFRRNEARSGNFISIQSQSRFGDGPDISLSARDHDVLRAGGFQLKSFCQRSWHHGKRRPGVRKKLDFFNTSCRTGQMPLYVEQSHIKSLVKNLPIVTQPTINATQLVSPQKADEPADLPAEQPTKFEFVVNIKMEKQIGLTIAPDVPAGATKIIR